MKVIDSKEFAKRRHHFMLQMGNDSAAILTASCKILRNGDAHFPYRQDSNFYYLTGFTEPDAIAVFIPHRKEGPYILFNSPHDPKHEIWHGKRAGQEGAKKIYGANESYPIKEFEQRLPDLLHGCKRLFYAVGCDRDFDAMIMQNVNHLREKIRSGENAPHEFLDILPLISEMRLYKSPAEISLMQEAAKISSKGHARAMQHCNPGLYEYSLEAELLYEFTRHGSRALAYESIVGAGSNACTLHYCENSKELRDGELVLIDAGCEYQHYASDITRTFPVNGKFSEPQKAIYELVLKAQLAGIEQVRPGTPWNQIQIVMVRIITEGLVKLGILHGNVESLIEEKAYQAFYMHNSGHWLGLDVHDAGEYKIDGMWRTLEPGFVLTVEPGIYIADNAPGVDKQWRGIGVRIEDDVLVTPTGCEVLSKDAPKTIASIEALMSQTSSHKE